MERLTDEDLTCYNVLKTKLRNNKIAIILHAPHLYNQLSAKEILELKDSLEFVDEYLDEE